MAKQPQPWRSLTGEIVTNKKDIKAVSTRSPFFNTGVHPNGLGGLDSDNFVAGTSGFSFQGDTGNAEFNDLTLRGGIVGNAALAEPVRAVQLHDDKANFPVGTAWSSILSATATVPDGYTQALILTCATGATAQNSTAAVDFLYTRTVISPGSLPGWAIGSVDVDATGTGVSYDLRSGLVSGLTAGSTLTFTGQICSAFGSWAAFSGNVANLDVAMLWLR